MPAQAAGNSVNQYLSVFIIVAMAAVVFGAVGYVVGRGRGWQLAKHDMQIALERAARDVRLFARNRYGAAPASAPALVLREVEQILWFRSRGTNFLVKPTGESRMRPPNEPRSERRRKENIRNEIWNRPKPADDDTGQVSQKKLMQRRYRG